MRRPYDHLAHVYDPAFALLERYYLGEIRKRLLRDVPPHSAILEIGAGTGANFDFYPRDCRAAAIEISGAMIKKSLSRPRRPHIVQADAQNLPFTANYFDAAFATLVFCSVPSPAKGFREAFRVLKPGGSLLLVEHVRPPGRLGTVFDVLSRATVALIDDHFDRDTAKTVAASGFIIRDLDARLGGALNIISAIKPEQ